MNGSAGHRAETARLSTLHFLACVMLATGGCSVKFTDDSASGVCGNGILELGEYCDLSDLGAEDCTSLGYQSGQLACRSDCRFDVSDCAGGFCGNGFLDLGEECDGPDLGGQTCTSLGYEAGDLSCTSLCRLDRRDCLGGHCGNGFAEAGEQCDGTDLGDLTCPDMTKHTDGELGCTEDCLVNVSGCHTCGDGNIEGPEECDGANLADETCGTQTGHEHGTLYCDWTCAFDLSVCHTCGNGEIEGPEDCDGTPLAQTCQGRGHQRVRGAGKPAVETQVRMHGQGHGGGRHKAAQQDPVVPAAKDWLVENSQDQAGGQIPDQMGPGLEWAGEPVKSRHT